MYTSLQQPMLSIWFGNFYCPAFDDRAFLDASMNELRDLGFNTVELDSKDWQDFRDYFDGQAASPYVNMQMYMMDAMHALGLGHMFLALYLCGDNLYPHIRFSPPVYGESVTAPDGKDGRWYRYWSEKSRDTQTEHVGQLMKGFSEGHAEIRMNGRNVLPLCSMWDPVVAPSFDEDGLLRYTAWLKRRYGTIAAFNEAYGTAFPDFASVQWSDLWFTLRYKDCANGLYSHEDLMTLSSPFRTWADNMLWRADELTEYFAAMKERLHSVDPRLFLMPNLSQWSHFLNIDTSGMPDVGLCDLWDTANRGIDMRAVSQHVDMAHWFTVPVTMDGTPDPYVVSCQHAHMRSMNPGRDFLGGIYWGRFLYTDVYQFLTPEEIIGSIVASGARGIAAYGWCGLDDGGILHRMDESFMTSLKAGNEWARRVMPLLGERIPSRIAILFPTQMALLEPLGVEGAAMRRSDLLGLYRFCCDLGFAPDLVEAQDVLEGLHGRQILLIPANDCWHAKRDQDVEKALRDFVHRGGVIIHSAQAETAQYAFSIAYHPTDDVCYRYLGEGGLLSQEMGFVCPDGEALAVWCESGKACVTSRSFGQGKVISFGFLPGYQYVARKAPHVPLSQGNHALYPFGHMERNVLRDVLLAYAQPDCPLQMKDVECASFANGWIVVNHRSTPVRLPESSGVIFQREGYELHGHASAYIPLASDLSR